MKRAPTQAREMKPNSLAADPVSPPPFARSVLRCDIGVAPDLCDHLYLHCPVVTFSEATRGQANPGTVTLVVPDHVQPLAPLNAVNGE